MMVLSAVVAVQSVLVCNAFAEQEGGPPLSAEAAVSNTDERSMANAANRAIARDGSSGSSDANSPSSDDEYNFSWLDPDKKVYVLQNRKYRKKGHLAVFASGGIDLSNPYRTEYEFLPRVDYWFTEQFGLEAFFSYVGNYDNQTLTALKNASPTALPYVRETRSFFGGALTWTPWYAKLNFFNKILYFDWYVLAGLGQISSAVDQNTRADKAPNFRIDTNIGFFYGTGHQYYVTRNFLVRLDLLGMTFQAAGADNQLRSTSSFQFSAGLGWLF